MAGIRGIHHIGISVPSLVEAKAFYVGTLGFALVDETHFPPSAESDAVLALKQAESRVLMLKASNLFLEVFEFSSPRPAEQGSRPVCDHGYTHFALEVDDIAQSYEELAEAGVRWHCEPIDTGDGYLMTYGRDPFGNVIEIQQLIGGLPYSFDALERREAE